MKKLLIIGGGNMGLAIASGIVKQGFNHKNILIVEKKFSRVNFLKKLKYNTSTNLKEIFRNHKKSIGIVILAVKPQDMKTSLTELKELLSRHTLVISIAAGIKISHLAQVLGKSQPIARVMPNTPCQINQGMSILSFNKSVENKHKNLTKKIFNSIGKTVILNEKYFDLIGAINGSGPAYFCSLIEALIQSGVKQGLSRDIASNIVLQTSLGTNLLLNKKSIKPEDLRKAVTSPKGITEEALKIYKKRKFNDLVHSGIVAAKKRSIELGKQ